MESIEKIFDDYTNKFMSDTKNLEGYIDKYNHSYFVRDEALSVDSIFTKYNSDFKKILEIESLYHDIGRFKQLQLTGSFVDFELASKYPWIQDHGDLGAIIMRVELLRKLFPKDENLDNEIIKVIQLHAKNNKNLLSSIKKEYLKVFRNYDLVELFKSKNSKLEREALTAINTAIIQDSDRLDIFRKIVSGIWVPKATNDKIDDDIWESFKNNTLPTISELRKKGVYNPNVGHLIRMSFINQMCLVPELQKIKDEDLIEKVYKKSGNEMVRPAYDFAKERIDTLIRESDDKILVKRK